MDLSRPDGRHAAVLRARRVIWDFDGPLCGLFDGYPATDVADELLASAPEAPAELQGATDTHVVVRALPRLEPLLAAHEIEAAATAAPTPGSDELVAVLLTHGATFAVASNNCAAAVRKHLADRGLLGEAFPPEAIFGREPDGVGRMKPDPYVVVQAMGGHPPAECLMIGDSVADVAAARAAGVGFVGYANREEKVRLLRDAGAQWVVRHLDELTRALPPTPSR
ncbi:hypothetical protein BIV57_09580 [Mangrovactinospora gilvigrisea]|uniref:HAD family hydrolase n=1 Tax=Mangrovactinospora gilvigrisea TaxID=1428644 RepID=A0A1J7BGJ3_9ACTN|nr:HAD family hydrolase [Mangrovactinospora gilvigrisea]OIV37803.1 hypothetical protein BIV57_09580 [Mangrovactinospora gilvigrisea]